MLSGTKIVTFYSYKGGVGRTMGLVNTAHVLARAGWRVLMVDFDLEAPGMTHFFRDLVVRQRSRTFGKDALDLLLDAKSTLSIPSDAPRISITDYTINVALPSVWEHKSSPYLDGRLDLIPATLEPATADTIATPPPDYLKRMDALDLSAMFSPGGPGHRFGDHVRRLLVNYRFETKGDILFTLRERISAAYDIVLIDSRTGLNEISGLCIGPLCDALVICSGLNDQNIEGTRFFMQKAGLLDKEKAKPFVVAAGPVPVWHTKQSEERTELLRKKVGAGVVVQVPYHPSAAISETVFVKDEPNDPITKAYEQLAPALTSLVALDLEAELRRLDSSTVFLSQSNLVDLVASWLPRHRLQNDHSPLGERGWALAVFPTACAVRALPRRNQPLRIEDASNIAIAAAVAALRSRSDRPFDRAWKFVGSARSDVARLLGIRLLFMQLRILRSRPSHAQAQQLFEDVITRLAAQPVERSSRGFAEYVLELDELSLALESRGHRAGRGIPLDRSTLVQRWTRLSRQFAAWILHRMARHPVVDAPVGPEAASELFTAQLDPEFSPETSERLRKTLNSFKTARLRIFFDKDLRPTPEALHSQLENLENIQVFPLGMCAEVAIAGLCVRLGGTEAVEDALTWLAYARMSYGYAWHVHVDWTQFELVKEHPSFVAFLKQDDQDASEVEGQIDRGVFTM